jgi:tetratricopeptide (TPR) repeat protein
MAESGRIEELRRRVQLDPASIAFAALAEEYRRAGRFEDAVATCEAGLRRHPAYLSARVTLGRALLEMGRLEDARGELEHVLRIAPENLAAIRGLAEIHHRRGGRQEETADEGAALAALGNASNEPAENAAAAPVASPDAAPIRLVQQAPAEAPATRPEATSAPVHATPVTPVVEPEPIRPLETRTASPDVAAIPELEEFLAAIRRARKTLPAGDTPLPPATDR